MFGTHSPTPELTKNMGDYLIDRGDYSAELIDFATCTQGVHSVLGNHESLLKQSTIKSE